MFPGTHENSAHTAINNYSLQLYFCSRIFSIFFPCVRERAPLFFFLFCVCCHHFTNSQLYKLSLERFTVICTSTCECLCVQCARIRQPRPGSRHTSQSTDQPTARHKNRRQDGEREREWSKCIGRLGFVSIECYTCTLIYVCLWAGALSSEVITRYLHSRRTNYGNNIIFSALFSYPSNSRIVYTWRDDTHFHRLVYRFRYGTRRASRAHTQ